MLLGSIRNTSESVCMGNDLVDEDHTRDTCGITPCTKIKVFMEYVSFLS